MSAIYLDHAATTPLHPAVLERMLPILTDDLYGNPSSLHSFGRAARAALTDARDRVASLLGCQGRGVIFTSGGTESDNLALLGCIPTGGSARPHIITTSIEHHAVLNACARLESMGCDISYVPVEPTGLIDPAAVREAIRPNTVLISVMYVNNEVGTIQPIEEIGLLAQERGILMHVDAVQALGAFPFQFAALPVDLLSVSAHKINGPKGVGALIASEEALKRLGPLSFGGGQEHKRRAGTENVAGIVGFAEAVAIARLEQKDRHSYLKDLGASWLTALERELPEGAFVLNGHPTKRVLHIWNISFPGMDTETLLMNLDLAGIAVSSGSACSSGSLKRSHVLQAMGLQEDLARSAIRFSFGRGNTTEQVEYTAKKLATFVRRLTY